MIINRLSGLSILAVLCLLTGCKGPQTKKNPEIVTPPEENVVSIGTKMGGHFDEDLNYWVTEDTGYESSSISETSPYTQLYRVDEQGNILGTGLMNNKGEVLVAPKYASMDLQFNKQGICAVGDKNNKWGFVTDKGEVVEPQYDQIWSDLQEGGWMKVQNGGLQGYINLEGTIVIPLEYLSLGESSEGLIEFCKEPQKWGYINTKNEIVIEPFFTNARPFQNGKVVLQKSDGVEYTVYKDGRIEKK